MGRAVVADFETTTSTDDCRVWAWGLGDIDTETYETDGVDIESFLHYMSASEFTCYFHNLAYDGSFIVDWLLRKECQHVTERKLKPWQFSTLISGQGKWYSIRVRWPNGNVTEFRDSLKKLPLSVKEIAKAFGTEESKGVIDYNAYREPGHPLTDNEREYLKSDVMIVVHALRVQFVSGMTKLTVGSDSLAEYKRLYSNFDRNFPILPLSIDTDIRRAYRGGFTYLNDKFKARPVGSGKVFDVNSLYPSVMYDRLLPYGVPEWRNGEFSPDESFPLFIGGITFTARLKKNHIPCIQLKNNSFYVPTQYQSNIDEPVTLSVTNVDLALWQEHYDMDILEYHGGWYFHGMTGMFKEYIDKWSEIKANSTGGLRFIAKIHLNSLYGKFATNPDITGKVPILEDDHVKLIDGPQDMRKPIYTAMGVFITAYARDVTIRAAQAHYDIFAYADTDSLHLITDKLPTDLDIHPTRLGAWKHESDFIDARFMRAKCYVELEDKCTCGTAGDDSLVDESGRLLRGRGGHDRACGYVAHIAGLPVEIADRVTFDDLENGHVFTGKLLPKRVPGGIVLTEVGYTLKY